VNEVILAYSRLARQLPEVERARWRARVQAVRTRPLSREAHAQSQSVLGVALACHLLSSASGRRVAPEELRYSMNGKREAPGRPQFSIAHAGELVLCALSMHGTVGVDLEPLVSPRSLPRWLAVFDARERAAARSARAALGIWTTKEAVLKAADGTLADLKQVRVRGRRVEFRGRRWHCRALHLGARVIARLVTDEPVTRLTVRALPMHSVLRA